MYLQTLLLCTAVILSINLVNASKVVKGCAHIKTCADPFPMLVDLIQKDKASALVALTYGVLLDSICSKQTQLNECMSKYSCRNFEKSYVSHAVKDILEFICGEGKEVLLTEAGCFSRDDFEWGTYQCSRAMRLESEIASLQSQAATTSKPSQLDKSKKGVNDRLCRVFQNLLGCIHVNVERTCSLKAANFTRSVFVRSVKPFAKQLGCNFK